MLKGMKAASLPRKTTQKGVEQGGRDRSKEETPAETWHLLDEEPAECSSWTV